MTVAVAAPACPGCAAPLGSEPMLRGRDRLIGAPGDFAVIRCQTCGLASTQPQLGSEDFAVYYPDTYSAYDQSDARGRHLVERLRYELILRLGPYRPLYRRPPGRLLDVGCGAGELADAFARHGWDVAGVEPSAKACAAMRSRGLSVHCGTLDDAPWAGPEFDAIVFNHSLEHIPNPQLALSRAAALLRPGGMLAVAVPNFGSWHRRVFGSCWFQLDLPRHLQHFDEGTLTAMVERAGLARVAVRTQSMRPSPLASVQYALFGRRLAGGRAMRLAAWAVAPLLLLSDVVASGDCLHVFGVRSSDEP
jgi:2-polyprenyl-3-methyl-5-hydroxy-6-metoxy-1,4-benzoquinol methylase